MKGCGGFTLIELLIVAVILSFVAMVVAPSFSSHQDEQKLALAAQEVADALRHARSEAMRSGEEHHLRFNTSTENFKVLEKSNGKVLYHPAGKQPFDVRFDLNRLLEGVDIVSVAGATGNVDLRFDSSGVPVTVTGEPETVSPTIVLSYAGQVKTLVVGEGTGRVLVQ